MDDSWVEMEPHYVVRLKGEERYVDAVRENDLIRVRSNVDRPFATKMTREEAYGICGRIQYMVPVKVTAWKRFIKKGVRAKKAVTT